jgi:hypothetical protein
MRRRWKTRGSPFCWNDKGAMQVSFRKQGGTRPPRFPTNWVCLNYQFRRQCPKRPRCQPTGHTRPAGATTTVLGATTIVPALRTQPPMGPGCQPMPQPPRASAGDAAASAKLNANRTANSLVMLLPSTIAGAKQTSICTRDQEGARPRSSPNCSSKPSSPASLHIDRALARIGVRATQFFETNWVARTSRAMTNRGWERFPAKSH